MDVGFAFKILAVAALAAAAELGIDKFDGYVEEKVERGTRDAIAFVLQVEDPVTELGRLFLGGKFGALEANCLSISP